MSTATDTAAHADSPRKIDRLLARYGESHRHPRNETIHFFAVPLILLSLLGMLYAAHPWIAFAFAAASLVYYARLSPTALLCMTGVTGIALLLVRAMGEWVLPLSAAIFVAAWIAQFIGHKIEGRKPSFLEDLRFLWVAPLFVLGKLFGKMGLRW